MKARYEVFRRLNKQGSTLSDQEIRNCTARLLGKEFPNLLRDFAEKDYIRAALSLSEEAVLRMGVEEQLLRLLAFNFSPKPLKHEISEFLDDFMAFASEGKFKLTADKQSRIERAFELIQQALPNGRAFRYPRTGFSTNLFDVVATGVFHNVEHLTPADLISRHEALMGSEKLKEVTGPGSNSRKKLTQRLELGKQWFKK